MIYILLINLVDFLASINRFYSYRFNILKHLFLSVLVYIVYLISKRYFSSYYLVDLTIVLYLLSIVDIRFREVDYIFTFIYFVFTVTNSSLNVKLIIFRFLIVFTFLTLFDKLMSKLCKVEVSLGGADILILSISSITLGLFYTYVSLVLASIFGLIVLSFTKEKGYFPFVPFLSIGIIISYLLMIFIGG